MPTLILLRHGESQWNKENRFTGWTDIGLSEKGQKEAVKAGKLLCSSGYLPDIVFTSLLKRAIKTAELCLDTMGLSHIEVRRTWRLNERHYGALQGESKNVIKEKFGEEQLKIWRRSYDQAPPPLKLSDSRHPKYDTRYKDLPLSVLPATESLKDVLIRFKPYWEDVIYPALRCTACVLIVAHGNSLRALIKHLENISDEEILDFEIATGSPRIYTFSSQMKIKSVKSL